MALEINALFNKFLEFAQSQANAASSKAVARIVEGEKGEKAPLAGRNITAANGDLSGEDAVIQETHFGQDLTANIAQRANEA